MVRTENYPSPTMIRWGSVVAGAVIGLAVLSLLTSLFVALGAEATGIADNAHWFGLASAIVALFVAGMIAGWFTGSRGTMSGMLHGITVWGLILVVTLAVPFPATFGVFEAFAVPLPELGTGPLWATFLSLLIGLIAAAIGGLIGGMMGGPTEEDRRAQVSYARQDELTRQEQLAREEQLAMREGGTRQEPYVTSDDSARYGERGRHEERARQEDIARRRTRR